MPTSRRPVEVGFMLYSQSSEDTACQSSRAFKTLKLIPGTRLKFSEPGSPSLVVRIAGGWARAAQAAERLMSCLSIDFHPSSHLRRGVRSEQRRGNDVISTSEFFAAFQRQLIQNRFHGGTHPLPCFASLERVRLQRVDKARRRFGLE